MSLFYEEAGSFIRRRAVGSVGPVVSRTEATPRWAGSAMGLQPSMFTGDFMGFAHRSPLARSAGGVSRRFYMLAAVADVGRAGSLAAGLAEAAGTDGRARAVGLGGGISRRDLCHREKRGLGIGKTGRGKGTKCMVVVDVRGVGDLIGGDCLGMAEDRLGDILRGGSAGADVVLDAEIPVRATGI